MIILHYPTAQQELRPPAQHALGSRLTIPNAVLSRSGGPFHVWSIRTAR